MSSWRDELRRARRLVRICVLIALVLIEFGIGQRLAEPRMPSGRGVRAMLGSWLHGLSGTAGLWAFRAELAVLPLALARLVWRVAYARHSPPARGALMAPVMAPWRKGEAGLLSRCN
ncbi:hypothetical protein B0920_18955 [Massilia sp. KIM]|uniref:hypothetical protein n=1 Tax=Massilia sp. KIM TaxID=1955422 RepID=UPI00098EF41D|nr:hypothetical protein [Massilia sp. KIM]OON61016.1 hypothetical protein B0920_18955 [Massilia sp. KIM]